MGTSEKSGIEVLCIEVGYYEDGGRHGGKGGDKKRAFHAQKVTLAALPRKGDWVDFCGPNPDEGTYFVVDTVIFPSDGGIPRVCAELIHYEKADIEQYGWAPTMPNAEVHDPGDAELEWFGYAFDKHATDASKEMAYRILKAQVERNERCKGKVGGIAAVPLAPVGPRGQKP
jgi:hypothetical protein